MGKYDAFGPFFAALEGDEHVWTFDEFERLTGVELPPSARRHAAWWSGVGTRPVWREHGWHASPRFAVGEIRFSRTPASPGRPGKSAASRTQGWKPQASPGTHRPSLGREKSGHRQAVRGPSPVVNRPVERRRRVAALIEGFAQLLDHYDREVPFDRPDQYEYHRRTIDLRRQSGSVHAALADERFLRSLHATLRAWGIGSRGSRLLELEAFTRELLQWSMSLERLDGLLIDAPDLDVEVVGRRLWALISGIAVVENQTRLVALSKTLHHLLPDLVPPIDRRYTQQFFLFAQEFQSRQQEVFSTIWGQFVAIARAVDPHKYVGVGWRTSRSKVIDNAIVAFVLREQHAGQGGI